MWNGNLLLDDLLGAEVRFVGDVTWTGLLGVMAWPIGTSTLSQGMRLAAVIWCQRLEKAPQMVLSTRLVEAWRTETSITPVEEEA